MGNLMTRIQRADRDVLVLSDRTKAVIVRCRLCFESFVEVDSTRWGRLCPDCLEQQRAKFGSPTPMMDEALRMK